MKYGIGIVLFFCTWLHSFAQIPEGIKVDFQDRHSSPVTHMEMHPGGRYFFTGDETGKILMWDKNEYRFVKTISPSKNNRPVRGMGFRYNGNALLVSEGYQGRLMNRAFRLNSLFNPGFDSLAYYYPFHNMPAEKAQLSFDLFARETDSIFLSILHKEQNRFLLGLSDGNSNRKLPEIPLQEDVFLAAISADERFIVTASPPLEEKSRIKIFDTAENKWIYEHEINGSPVHLHVDDAQSAVFIFLHHSDKKTVSLSEIGLKNLSLKNDIAEFPFGFSPPSFVKSQKEETYRLIFLSPYSPPLLLEKKGKSFMPMNVELPHQNITAATFVPGTHHFLYWTDVQANVQISPSLFVYDFVAGKLIERHALSTRNPQRACFLPGGHWSVTGIERSAESSSLFSVSQSFIKFFKQGTLNNRFGKLRWKDYMQVAHGIEVTDFADFTLDEANGKMAFYATVPVEKDQDELGLGIRFQFVIYDLLNDKIDVSISQKANHTIPIAYREKTGRILASYGGQSSDFEVFQKGKTTPFEGQFMLGELSSTGESLLLVDDQKKVEIYDVSSKKKLLSKSVDGRNFKAGPIDDESFWISYEGVNTELSVYEGQTILFTRSGSGYKETAYPKMQISGMKNQGNNTVIIAKNVGLIINSDKYMLFQDAEFPEYVSLNEEGTSMMVSFSNGLIRLYNTENLELQGTMIHPDFQKHIIIKKDGNFIANTSPQNYLFAKKNGKSASLDEIAFRYNKPHEVLSLFGPPSDGYYALLAKAADFIKARNETKTDLSTEGGARVLSILLNGQKNLSVTDKKTITLEIEAKAENTSLQGLEIRLNRIPVLKKEWEQTIPKGETGKLSATVSLTAGENYLEFILTDDQGLLTATEERFVLVDEKENDAELYLLSIGVSDYQQNAYNLTFADKDALDLAVFYGDTLTIDMPAYRKKFHGERFYVAGSEMEDLGEINYYAGLYASMPNLIQADYTGRYWLESATGNSYFLWDFKNKSRNAITLPLTTGFMSDFIVYPDPENRYFYFVQSSQWYRFGIDNKKTEKVNIPAYANFSLLTKNRMAEIVENNGNFSLVFINLNADSEKKETWDIPLDFNYFKPELLTVSPAGNQALIALNDEIWMLTKNIGGWDKKRISQVKHAYANRYYFTEDQTAFSCMNSFFDLSLSRGGWKHYVFHLPDSTLDSLVIENDYSTYIGPNIIGGKLKWVSAQPPIAKTSVTLEDYLGARAQIQPVSFRKVHILTLTNEQATQKGIEDAFGTFLSHARIQDQVMVFIAGHGTLDSAMNYYFAPHDMDFKQLLKKGLSYAQIVSMLGKVPALRKLLIMDTCHSGEVMNERTPLPLPVAENENRTDRNQRGADPVYTEEEEENERVSDLIALFFQNISSSEGITVLAASTGSDVAYESKELSNGAFTTAFIEGMENKFKTLGLFIDQEKLRPVELTDEFIYGINKQVISSTKGKQIPNVREMNEWSKILLW
jgi:WD40 repeat protein